MISQKIPFIILILKICESASKVALEITCGKNDVNPPVSPDKGSCKHGLAGTDTIEEWKQAKSSPTPESIKYWTKKRDELFVQAGILRDGGGPPHFRQFGYKHCSLEIRQVIENKNCFNVYNIVFDEKLKQLAQKKCEPGVIKLYVEEFAEIVDKGTGPMRMFQVIKNEYAMARLCTIRIVNFARTLDDGLKEATEKLNTANHSTPRETVSMDGR